VRIAVDAHRAWTLDAFRAIATEAEVPDAGAVARQLMLLRDGAMVNGYLGEPETIADALDAAFSSVVAAARVG